MTIPAAPVSLLAVQAEFGKNMPTTASNFLAYKKWYSTSTGGYYVGVTPYTANISTGTPILSLASFAGEAVTYGTATFPLGSTSTYTAPGTETIPSGAQILTVEVWGGGGSGGAGTAGPPALRGGGGSSGGYVRAQYALTGTNWGQQFGVRVGTGGAASPTTAPGFNGGQSTVTSISFAVGGGFTTILANAGTFGSGGGPIVNVGGIAGTTSTQTGGTAPTGGNNPGGQAGNPGSPGGIPVSGGGGGAAVAGIYSTGAGAGGVGGPNGANAGNQGSAGQVIFHYS